MSTQQVEPNESHEREMQQSVERNEVKKIKKMPM
jgi:hypothetical protein